MPPVRPHSTQEPVVGSPGALSQTKKKHSNGTTGLTNVDPKNILNTKFRGPKGSHMAVESAEGSRSQQGRNARLRKSPYPRRYTESPKSIETQRHYEDSDEEVLKALGITTQQAQKAHEFDATKRIRMTRMPTPPWLERGPSNKYVLKKNWKWKSPVHGTAQTTKPAKVADAEVLNDRYSEMSSRHSSRPRLVGATELHKFMLKDPKSKSKSKKSDR